MNVRYISPESLLARLHIKKDQSSLFLLTGPRDAGKTSCCLKLVEEGRRQRLSLGGLISPPVLINGIKLCIDLLNVANGERRRLAHHRRFNPRVKANEEPILPTESVLSMGAWCFDTEVLAWGNAILEQLEDCDLFFLDEIGPLEFNHSRGFQAGFHHLDARCHRLSFVAVRPDLMPQALERWPWARIFPLTACQEINGS
ncbi:MAG: nucleoside-triphosphatase [Anaerolineales bacterium]